MSSRTDAAATGCLRSMTSYVNTSLQIRHHHRPTTRGTPPEIPLEAVGALNALGQLHLLGQTSGDDGTGPQLPPPLVQVVATEPSHQLPVDHHNDVYSQPRKRKPWSSSGASTNRISAAEHLFQHDHGNRRSCHSSSTDII